MEELACFEAFVPFEPRIFGVVESGQSVGNHFQRLGFFTNANNIAGLNSIRSDVDYLTVYSDVTVKNELTGSCACGSDAKTVNYVVETTFKELKEYFTGDTFGAGSFVKEVVELLFKYTVGIFGFLFFAKLSAILRGFAMLVGTVLAWREVFLSQYLVFAKYWFAEFASDFRFGTCVSCHC